MLTRTECLELVGTTEFGHLTFTRRALPVVVPAHYVLDGDRVQIHASTGGNPDLWRDGEIVALHVDAFDADQRAGWSVSVTGAAQAAANLVGAESLSRAPWLPAGGGNFIAVSTDLVWGQRFGPAREAIGDHYRVDSTGRSLPRDRARTRAIWP
jgi:Pyridoxamine 5'-phosphate oxidase